jgi:OmpA-OmpF porin, OOP family
MEWKIYPQRTQRMNKLALAVITATVSLVATASLAADVSRADNFFVNANVGNSHLSGSPISNKNASAYGINAGYRWADTYGVEAGYSFLGTAKHKVPADAFESRLRNRAITLGANGKYHFSDDIYLSARGGIARLNYSASNNKGMQSQIGRNGYYAGVGMGYDFSANFGAGLQYDNYRATSGRLFAGHANLSVLSANAEYRF